MSNFNLENVLQALAVQTSVNVANTTAAQYVKFLANLEVPQIPGLDTLDDKEMVGDGFSRIERNLRNHYWQDKEFPIRGLLNDHIAAILLNKHQGGAVTPTNLTAPAKNLSCVQNVTNSIPKLLSLYRSIGGEKFIHSTMAVDTYRINQTGEADPTFEAGLKGTGHHLDPDELVTAAFDENAIADAPEYEYFHGAATQVFATDGIDTYNWTQDGELIDLSIEAGNGIVIGRRPGDNFKNAVNRNSGAYPRKIRMGDHTGMINLKVDLDSSLRTFKAMVAGKKLTGLTIIFGGYNKVGATSNFYEFEVKAPQARFKMIEGDSDENFGALSVQIQPTQDKVSRGRFTNRTLTDKTLI